MDEEEKKNKKTKWKESCRREMDDREKRETESKEANFNQVVGMARECDASSERSIKGRFLPNFSFYFYEIYFDFKIHDAPPHLFPTSRLYLFSIDVQQQQQGCVIFSLSGWLPQLL